GIAIVTGLRADICAMPVASLRREVCAAVHTSGENASELHDSPVQIESNPSSSTCCARSMSSRPPGGCAVQYPSWSPSLRSVVTAAHRRRRAQPVTSVPRLRRLRGRCAYILGNEEPPPLGL